MFHTVIARRVSDEAIFCLISAGIAVRSQFGLTK
jgi:hypothetical protein